MPNQHCWSFGIIRIRVNTDKWSLTKLVNASKDCNDITQAKKAGKTVEEAVKGWTPPPGFTTPPPVRLQGNVQTIYDELK